MYSAITEKFREAFLKLPADVQGRARKAYRLWCENPRHPSLHFKKVGEVWSVRVDRNYRVLGYKYGERIYWFWIGVHRDYELLIARFRNR